MPVQFICPNCQKLLSVGSRKIGCQVNCPKCASQVVVPAPEEAAAAVAMARAVRERLSVLEVPISELTGFDETPEGDIDRLPLIAPAALESPHAATGRAPREPALVSVAAVSAVAGGASVSESEYSGAPVAQAAPAPLAAVGREIPTATAVESSLLPASAALPGSQTPGVAAPIASLPPLRSPAHREMIMISRITLYVQAVLLCLVAAVAFAVGYAVGRGSPPPVPVHDPMPVGAVLDDELGPPALNTEPLATE